MYKFLSIFLFTGLLLVDEIVAQNEDAFTKEGVHTPSIALKTNLLYDATFTVNAGLEFKVARKLSLDLPFNLNVWTFAFFDNNVL